MDRLSQLGRPSPRSLPAENRSTQLEEIRTKTTSISCGLAGASTPQEVSVTEFGDQRLRHETADPGALPPQPTLSVRRRTVLRAAGLVALSGAGAATLASCSAEAESGSPSASPGAATTPPPASPPPTADATSPKPSASNAQAPDGPSVATAEVPVGGGVILDDADYVVTQPNKGEYKAFSKICTHQGCPVGSVNNGVIHCECHGSEYSIEDGSVTNPPATKGLAEAETTVFRNKVYITG